MDLLEARSSRVRRHPWEGVRFEFFHRLLSQAGLLRRGVSILDVGSGDAWFGIQLARSLAQDAAIVCWDRAYKTGGPPPIPAKLPIRWSFSRPREVFDALLLLDVLEHIEDDRT